ncbi:MAG: DEAD/DEAH box helicase [Bacteroidetes bacterium]|nr:MAG: DEAD/DEAH box helicase [Bacteroidota bacterium]TAG85967.1 MAG: DEAD/DEAH box helicase [Bacteroidota bacterium]
MQNDFNNWSQTILASLWIDGGLRVFQYYGFEPSRKAQKENPLRDEKTSSFYVVDKYNKVFFKDFGDDTLKGDAIKFVQLFEQVDYKNALKIIASIYGLENIDFINDNSNQKRNQFIKKINTKKTENLSFEKKLINIQFKDFSKEELDFWYKKGLITKNCLENNNVKSVESFEIKISEEKTLFFKNLEFVFAYTIVENESYKLYMPKPKFRVYAQSKTVFLPNLSKAKEIYGENYAYSFGLESLHPEKPIIICGGEPDCLALQSMGFSAFTLGDERSTIPDYILEKIKKVNPNPEISVLYDTDYTGLKSSLLLEQRYNFQRLILPKLEKQKNKSLPKPEKNDLCDYINTFGVDATLELCLYQNKFKNKDYHLHNVPSFIVKKYLSEKIDILANFITQNKRTQIDADAGIGKTFTMLSELPQKINMPIIFCVPFALQVEQIEQEYNHKVNDLVCFTNQAVKNDTLEIEALRIGKVNVCTYDRLKIIFKRTKDIYENILVVIDESHLLTSEYAYRTQTIHEVLETCEVAEKVVYLSATPDYALCNFSNFQLLKIKREQNPTLYLEPIDYSGDAKNALWQLLKTERNKEIEAKETDKLTIVRLNNKVLSHVIADLLIENGLYQNEEIDFIYSEKRQSSRTTARTSLIEHSEIPKNIRLLFVTACFDCGINLLNENIRQIINFETRYTDNCLDTLKQLVARFRKCNELKIKVCKPIHYIEKKSLDNKVNLYERLVEDAMSKIALLPYADAKFRDKINQEIWHFQNDGLIGYKTPLYLKSNLDISATGKILQKTNDDIYKVNYNYIRFCLKDYERKNLNSFDFYSIFSKEIPLVYIQERCILNNEKTFEEKEKLTILWQKAKEQKEIRTEQICENIRNHSQEFFEAIHAEFRDTRLKKSIQTHFVVTTTPATATPLNTFFEKENTQNGTETPKTAPVLEEEVVKLSHRYFHLKEMLVPVNKIPELLKNNADEVKYGELTKTLTNHLYLLAAEKTGNDLPLLVRDKRKLTDIIWLSELADKIEKLQEKKYTQKSSQDILRRFESLSYDFKLAQKEKNDAFWKALVLLNDIKNGAKSKAEYREAKRRFKAFKNKEKRIEEKLITTKKRLDESVIVGFTIDEISFFINKTKTHQSDWQGAKTNIRLLSSLFEIKTQKRLIQLNNGTTTEKTLITIGKRLTFEKALERFKFSETEAVMYKEYAVFEIETDLWQRKNALAKNENVSLQSTNRVFNTGGIIENAMGYPVFWD